MHFHDTNDWAFEKIMTLQDFDERKNRAAVATDVDSQPFEYTHPNSSINTGLPSVISGIVHEKSIR
jgi:hypothetical protein